uniref:Glycoprotein n=1 Tax=Acrobeloides nanus TaxID=290746 RepID=A0A914EQJ5_9BILA
MQTTSALDRFWTMWHEHYLKALREHHKTSHRGPRSSTNRHPTIGEVVIVHEEHSPRGAWSMGRIKELIKSKDGYIRVAKVQMANGHLHRRAISLLYPLEVSDDPREKVQPDEKDNESENAPELPEKQKADKKSDEQHRRTTRAQSRKAVTTIVSVLGALTLLACLPTTNGVICRNVTLNYVDETYCTEDGFEVWRMKDTGEYCWKPDPVARNKLHDCECPDWAEGCSYYASREPGLAVGNSTLQLPWVIQAMEKLRPLVCSFTATTECSSVPVRKDLIQVELYDRTIHYVTKLDLVWQDRWADEYTCIGSGQKVTGSPHYCDGHQCHEYGDRFCFYKQPPIAILIAGEHRVPIRAWGHVPVMIYDYLQNAVPLDCESCNAQCHPEGIELGFKGEIQLIEAIGDGFEYRIPTPTGNQTVRLSQQVTSNDYEVSIKFWSHRQIIKEIRLECLGLDFCSVHNCTLCILESLANHHCFEKTAVIVMGALTILILVPAIAVLCLLAKVLLTTLRIIHLVLKGILWCLKKCVRRDPSNESRTESEKRKEKRRLNARYLKEINVRLSDLKKQAEQNPLLNEEEEDLLFSIRPPKHNMMRIAPLITALILSGLLANASACGNTLVISAQSNQCFQSATSQTCHVYNTTLLDLLAKGQEVCLLLTDSDNRPAGQITLRAIDYELICEPRAIHWTREFRLESSSIRRCESKGSCQEGVCDNLPSNATVDELGTTVNSQLGYTRCDRGCGGWGCWCGWWGPSCIFSKFYAVPVTERVYTLITCAKWNPTLRMNVTIQLNETIKSEQMRLMVGHPDKWNGIEATLTSLNTAPITDPSPYFLAEAETKRISYIPPDKREKTSRLVCSSQQNAIDMNCNFAPTLCQATPGQETTRYTCPEVTELEELMTEPDMMLPSIQRYNETSFFYTQVQGAIIMNTAEALAQIRFTMSGLTLTPATDMNSITLTQVILKGCYSCALGALLTINCSTDYGTALAHADCPSGFQFAINCNTTGIRQTIRIYTREAEIDEECDFRTPTFTTSARVQGHLTFTAEAHPAHAFSDDIGPVQLGKGGIDWLDLFGLIFGNWKHVLLIIASGGTTVIALLLIAKLACCLMIWRCTRVPLFNKPRRSVADLTVKRI